MTSITARGAPGRSPGSRRRPSRAELDAVLAITAVSAIAGGLASTEPAGWWPADVLLSGGFAALVTYATAKARRWTWVVLAGVSTAATDGWGFAVGAVALVVATAASWPDRRPRPMGALVGALSVQLLLRLDMEGTGTSALVAALAIAPVFLSVYARSGRRVRRQIHIVALVAAGLAVATVALAVAVALVQRQVNEAADSVREGLDAVRDDDPDRALALLTDAAQQFDDANDTVALWALPARVFPVVGQHARALEVLTDEGAELADTAARATVEGDTDEIRFDDGVIDLDRVVQLEGPLADAAEELERASSRVDDVQTPWLLDPLSSGVAEFGEEVDEALPDAELAIDGVRVAPALFGGEGERRYFIAFTQPAEARGLGGFVGNFGELTAVDGDLELTRSGRIAELRNATDASTREISGPEDYLARYGRFEPHDFLQDLTFSPDGPSVAQVMEELYPQAGGEPVDGVIIVDPVGLAALMEFTGPISVPGRAEPLTSENAADFLIREQYLAFQEDEDARVDFLDEASEQTFEELTEGDIPGPREVSDVLDEVVDQGRLIIHSTHPAEQALVERVGLDGALPRVEGGDFFSVTTQNTGNSKIEVFLNRTVGYEATWDPESGRVDAEATIDLRNDAPSSDLPRIVIGNNRNLPPGTNLMFLSVYSALQLNSASLDDQPLRMEQQEERGRFVYSNFVEIPPGSTVTVNLRFAGIVEPGTEYRLGYAPQPLVNPDQVSLQVTPTEGWMIDHAPGFQTLGSAAVLETESSDDLAISAHVVRG